MDGNPWVQTQQFFNYLTGIAVYGGLEYKYRMTDIGHSTSKIPGTNQLAHNILAKDPNLKKLMENYKDADLTGALIFFRTNDNTSGWTHVAVITGKDKAGNWLIVDHSGPTAKLPRGYDSSDSILITQVAIVQVGNTRLWTPYQPNTEPE